LAPWENLQKVKNHIKNGAKSPFNGLCGKPSLCNKSRRYIPVAFRKNKAIFLMELYADTPNGGFPIAVILKNQQAG